MRISSVLKLIGAIALAGLVHITPVYAQNAIVVVSDLHLMFGNADHPNQRAFNNFLKIIKTDPEITDVIVNGDIFHVPTLRHVDRSQRITLVIEVLRQIQRETGARVHFNFGNHDQLTEKKQGRSSVDESFSAELKDAAEKAGIAVIGTDPHRIYEYRIGNTKFEISHFPFATSKSMVGQAERFSSNRRAFIKVTDVSQQIVENDGVVRIMSDSHTPLMDVDLNVFNTGKLAETIDLPQEPNTFLVVRNGQGRLMTVHDNGTVSRFRFRKSYSCSDLFL